MRYFLSTGEASGEASAMLLADAIARYDPQAHFEGIGAERMRAAGVALWRDHTGWASMGPLSALPRIPKLLATMWRTAYHLVADPPDLVVLVDFGAFNLRLASSLRRLGFARPILDCFPPGTWLDDPQKARTVASVAVPLTAFAHQRDFYQSLRLPIVYFGHPLVGEYPTRPPRPEAAADGGTVALLPGSRGGELRFHLPVLLEAARRLRARRPNVRFVAGAADARGELRLRTALTDAGIGDVPILRGVTATLSDADAAWVASGTAVLETALTGVPCVALYVITPLLVKVGRRMIRHRFITLPNLVLGREVIPELLQEAATPERLVDEIERVLRDPTPQRAQFTALREALGPADALEQCARFAVALAQTKR